jgi:hypothetical protein
LRQDLITYRDVMRRGKTQSWELDAREETERLRTSLDSLVQLERAMDGGIASEELFLRTLDDANKVTKLSTQWIAEWKVRARSEGASTSLAFDVFGTCLPILTRCVDIYLWSLGVFGMSTDIEGGDGESAGHALYAAKEVAGICLLLIQDTPALRPRHRTEASVALNGLLAKAKADRLVELGDEVYGVLGQLRREQGIDK